MNNPTSQAESPAASSISASRKQLDLILQTCAQEMSATNRLIEKYLFSEIETINELSHHIIQSGGKRLRPVTVILSALACGYEGTENHLKLAAIVEFIHTATLLHDDVVDASLLRRGIETANSKWGDHLSVLVGDFLYSRSFEMMVELDDMRILGILAKATNTIAEGEVMQSINTHNSTTDETTYREIIYCKTAKLFEAAAELGAVISRSSAEHVEALKLYGRHLGMAFQIVDDLLDYSAATDDTGKNLGDDLAEGKTTLPLIHAITFGTRDQADLIRNSIESGAIENLVAIQHALVSTNALDYTRQAAQQEAEGAKQSIDCLPDSQYKQALLNMADFSVARTF